MNARLPVGRDSLGEVLSGLWDSELERNALGAAMLGEPMPTWLKSEHFFPTQHQRIYQAVLDVGGNVALVNGWLRESAPQLGPIIARSDELAAMCLEWHYARDMGWALRCEHIVELYNQRQLVETMRRVEIELRHEQITHKEARKALAEHFNSRRDIPAAGPRIPGTPPLRYPSRADANGAAGDRAVAPGGAPNANLEENLWGK